MDCKERALNVPYLFDHDADSTFIRQKWTMGWQVLHHFAKGKIKQYLYLEKYLSTPTNSKIENFNQSK